MLQTKKYSHIDSTRGYAVLMVLLTHVFGIMCNRNPDIFLANVWAQCRMGVMLFYMISALTLFLSYAQKSKIENYPVRNFFIRRLFRIVPLFYIVCVYYILMYKFDSLTIVSTITFTNGFIPTQMMGIVDGGWSIVVEMIFYLTVPFLFRYINSINKAALFILLSLALSIACKWLVFRFLSGTYPEQVLYNWTYYWLPAQLPIFGLGIFLYFLFFKSGLKNENHLFNKPLSYLLAFLAIYFFVVLCHSYKLFITENLALSLALVLLIISLSIYPGIFLNNQFMQFLGKISYSFYLMHLVLIPLVIKVLNKFNISMGINAYFIFCFIIMLGLTTLISYLSYLYIEQPFQKWGARIIERGERKGINTREIEVAQSGL